MEKQLSEQEFVDEKELLLRVAEGDEAAFHTFFYKYLPPLHAFINRFTNSSFATEDVIQNLFIRVWLNRDKLKDVRSIRSWLYKCASNECLSYLRTLKQREGRTDQIDESAEMFAFVSDNPLNMVQMKEAKQLVTTAVNSLSGQRKRVYLLSRESGLTIPQIAGQLDISESTAKNTLVTSLKFIRGFLSRHGYIVVALFILL
jgi:RNA polymerase sigma-70 factor (family 1)